MKTGVIIVGAGGHAKVVADILALSGERVLGFLDDKNPKDLPGFNILGRIEDIPRFSADAIFIPAIGNNRARQQVMETYQVNWRSAIHPASIIAKDVIFQEGVVVMANAVINPGTVVGRGVIINTGATIDHDCLLGDFTHISPGAHLAGTVTLGKRTWVGIGGVVINNIDICADVIVGAGAVIVNNVNVSGKYIGIPGRLVHNII